MSSLIAGNVLAGGDGRRAHPRLAILIPTYNCEETVGETLASLQAVTSGWDHVDRVVVCDDASNDRTVTKIQQAEFTRCRLELLRHTQNRGEGNCYRTMLASLPATIEWFLILHADDFALSNFIGRNLDLIDRCSDKAAAVSSAYFVFSPTGERSSLAKDEDLIVWRGQDREHIVHTALVGTWWHISGSLVNRRLWEVYGGRDPSLPQLGDWDLMLKWQRDGYLVGHSLIPTTKYRVTAGGVSSRSYLEFRDIRERAIVFKRHSEVFTASMRWHWAARLAGQGGRRLLKLASQGNWKHALAGASTTVRATFGILF